MTADKNGGLVNSLPKEENEEEQKMLKLYTKVIFTVFDSVWFLSSEPEQWFCSVPGHLPDCPHHAGHCTDRQHWGELVYACTHTQTHDTVTSFILLYFTSLSWLQYCPNFNAHPRRIFVPIQFPLLFLDLQDFITWYFYKEMSPQDEL